MHKLIDIVLIYLQSRLVCYVDVIFLSICMYEAIACHDRSHLVSILN